MDRQAVPLHFDTVVPCVCREHSVVRLFDVQRVTRVQVRVSAGVAEAIAAGAEGRTSLPCSLVDALVGCMEAGGTVPVELILSQPRGEALLHLRTEDGGEDTLVPVEPGLGLLVARHLALSIVLSRAVAAAASEIERLAPFRDFIASLPWLPGEPGPHSHHA
jgi:hypothetical protein